MGFFGCGEPVGTTLDAMQASESAAPSPTSSSFAGLLAELASPDRKFPPTRDLDGLEDDIATLSYEHALRAQTRNRPAEPAALPPQAASWEPSESRLPNPTSQVSCAPGEPSIVPAPLASPERRKTSSITVRLSQPESDQLKQRAAEAGMTVSAYLRSCAFEVETLRAQVKQTVADLRRSGQETPGRSLWNRLSIWKKRAVANATQPRAPGI